MPTLRQSPFDLLRSDLLEADLFETLERQLNNADRQRNARLPATVTARKDGVAAVQAAIVNVAGVDSISVDGGLIQTTSG